MQKFLKIVIYLGLGLVAFVPLVTNSSFFFPFIFPKTILFRVTIEIIFLAYLFLAWKYEKYRFQATIPLVLLFFYIIAAILSSILGPDFYLSFWGDFERSEGILLLLHLLAYFIVLTGVLREQKNWNNFLEILLFFSTAVAFFALGQDLNLSFIGGAGEDRLFATIGNPAFLAGYLIFGVFFALYLFNVRNTAYLKIYYIVTFSLHLYIIFRTGTRGAFVGLIVALFLGLILLLIFVWENKKIRAGVLGAIILAGVLSGLLFFQKESKFVQNSPSLRRFASISLNDRTVETRILTWKSSWKGFLDSPILGYGYENFYLVFNKYFEPKIYEDAGSRVWFDRAHNQVLDRLIVGGILGLTLFLLLILSPFFILGQNLFKKDNKFILFFKKLSGTNTLDKKYIIIFICLFVAYFIQSLFVFDVLVIYIPLIASLAFIGIFGKVIHFDFFKKENFYKILFFISIFAFLPVFYNFNIKPVKAGSEIIDALRFNMAKRYDLAFPAFMRALSYNTYGNFEFRVRFVEETDKIIFEKEGDEALRRKWSDAADKILNDQLLENPRDVSNYLLLMRHYNRNYIYDISHLQAILDVFPTAIELSPTRPQFYYELGYAQYRLAQLHKGNKEEKKAEILFEKMRDSFRKAIDLNDRVKESYLNAISVLSAMRDKKGVSDYINEMKEKEIGYENEIYLKRLGPNVVAVKRYDLAIEIYEELVNQVPNNPEYLIQLALSYAHIGRIEDAIVVAERVKAFGPDYEDGVKAFIEQITNPDFLEEIKNG